MSACIVSRGCLAPTGPRVDREGDVDGLLDQHARVALGLERLGAGGEGPSECCAGLAQKLAGRGLVGACKRADAPVGKRQRGLVARVGKARLLELVERGGGVECLGGGVDCCIDAGGIERRKIRHEKPLEWVEGSARSLSAARG